MEDPRSYLTLQQIAEIAQVTLETAAGWVKSQQLRSVNFGSEPGKKIPRIRVRRDWWEEFEEARTKSPKVKAVRRKKAVADDTVNFIK